MYLYCVCRIYIWVLRYVCMYVCMYVFMYVFTVCIDFHGRVASEVGGLEHGAQ